MSLLILLKVFVIWGCILVLAVLNGLLRETVLVPKMNLSAGYVVSGLILSALIVLVAGLSLPWLKVSRTVDLVNIGLLWFALTVLFEFSFGLWQGKSWQTLFEAYTFKDGNIWPVVLLITVLSPYLAAKLKEFF